MVAMCFGGGSSGPSADEMYKEQKKDFGPLPSLKVGKSKSGKRTTPKYRDVKIQKTKLSTRSLINPNLGKEMK